MGALEKIISGLTQTIKLNERIDSLAEKVNGMIERAKMNESDIKNIDKRLIRIETFIEIAGKQKARLEEKV